MRFSTMGMQSQQLHGWLPRRRLRHLCLELRELFFDLLIVQSVREMRIPLLELVFEPRVGAAAVEAVALRL